jgi:hypothetical protein
MIAIFILVALPFTTIGILSVIVHVVCQYDAIKLDKLKASRTPVNLNAEINRLLEMD